MMSMEDRMSNAEFKIRAKLCSVCKNRVANRPDSSRRHTTRATCKVFGNIPEDIFYGHVYDCSGFELDSDKFSRMANFLPKDVAERFEKQL